MLQNETCPDVSPAGALGGHRSTEGSEVVDLQPPAKGRDHEEQECRHEAKAPARGRDDDRTDLSSIGAEDRCGSEAVRPAQPPNRLCGEGGERKYEHSPRRETEEQSAAQRGQG